MRQNFQTWRLFAWRPENDGQGDHTDENDPGGETNHGVTYATWQELARKGYVSGTLADAGPADLTTVLRLDCWHPCHCDELPAGIDVMVADMAMVAGSGAAAKCLQRIVGTYMDGDIGALTLKAVTQYAGPLPTLIHALLQADDDYYASLRQFRLWGNGWERRAKDCSDLALSLLVRSPSGA